MSVAPSATAWPAVTAMVEQARALGAEIVALPADRLTGLPDRVAADDQLSANEAIALPIWTSRPN